MKGRERRRGHGEDCERRFTEEKRKRRTGSLRELTWHLLAGGDLLNIRQGHGSESHRPRGYN